MKSDNYTLSSVDKNKYLNSTLYLVLNNLTVGAYIVYLFLGVSHIFVLENRYAIIMVTLAVTTSIFMLIFSRLLKDNNLPSDRAPFFSLIILLFILLNSFLHLFITNELKESTNIVIIIVGLSMIQYRSGWYIFSLLVTVLGWFFITYQWIGDSLWVHYVFSIAISSSLSVIFHITIRNFLLKLRLRELNWAEQKKQADSALADVTQTRKALQRLTEASIEGIAFHNGKMILDCNEQLGRIFGYNNKDEIAGLNLSSLIHPRELLKVSFYISDTSANVYETIGLKKDGTTFPMEVSGKTILKKEDDLYRVVIMRDLTAQKLVQKKLMESEANYRLLAENSSDIIYRYSEKNGLIYVSPSGMRITGYTPAELSEQVFFTEILKPDKAANPAGKNEKANILVHRCTRKDGTRIWLESVVKKRIIGDDTEIFGISRDISSRIKNELFLNVEYKVANLFSGNTDESNLLGKILQIICSDLDWVLGEFWYPASDPEEFLYREAVWSIADEKLERFIERSEGVTFRKGEGLPGIIWKTKKPFLIKNVLTSELFVRSEMAADAEIFGAIGVPVYDGESVYCFIVLFSKNIIEKDEILQNMLYSIGGQIGHFMKRKAAEKELSKSESLFRTMSKFSPVGIFVTNPEGRCIYTNKRYQDITKLGFDATMGRGWGSVFEDDGKGSIVDSWYDTVHKNQYYEGIHRITTEDGLRWVRVHGAAILDGEEIIGHVGTVEDITEFRKQEEKLIEYSSNLGKMVEERTKELELLQKELLQRQRDQQELELAADVQNSLLPDEAPVFQGFSIESRALPARYVSGDFYDFFSISSDVLQIIIADIAGKGIPAALLTATARAFLRSEVFQHDSPNVSLSSLNKMMFEDLSNAEKFITMQITQINRCTGKITYSSAGHTEVLIFSHKDKAVTKKFPTTMPLGIVENLESELNDFYLLPGDLMLLYSDGVTEAQNDQGQLFGIKRLENVLLKACRNDFSAESVIDLINNEISRFVASKSQSDDITIIAVKAEKRSFSIEDKGVLENLDVFVGWIMERCEAYSEEITSPIELAVSELITNIIKHSYKGQGADSGAGNIRIVMELELDNINIIFFDSGFSFDYNKLSEPDFSRAHEGGYGLWVIREVMDEVNYIPGSEVAENQWILKKYVS